MARVWRLWMLAISLCWCWLVLSSPVAAAAPSDVPQGLSDPRLQQRWIADRADVLTPGAEAQLNHQLRRFRNTTDVQIVVVTLGPTAPAETPRAYATELFNTWGIGQRGKDNGVLFLIAVGDRRIEIVTGRGLTPQLPDQKVAQLIQTEILPWLQSGEAERAVMNGATAIAATLAGQPLGPLPKTPEPQAIFWGLGAVSMALTLIGGGWLVRIVSHTPQQLPATGIQERVKTRLPQGFEAPFPAWLRAQARSQDIVATVGWGPTLPLLPLGCLGVGSMGLGATGVAFGLARHLATPLATGGWPATGLVGLGSVIALGLIHPLLAWAKRLAPGVIARNSLAWMGGLGLLSAALWAIAVNLFWVPAQGLVTWIGPLYVALWNGGTLWWLSREARWALSPNEFRCDRCQTPLVEVTQAEIQPYLSAPEQQSLTLRDRWHQTPLSRWRGWRCPACYPTLSREGCYGIYFRHADHICPQCDAVTLVDQPSPSGGSSGQQCLSCGYERTYDFSPDEFFAGMEQLRAIRARQTTSHPPSRQADDSFDPGLDLGKPGGDEAGGSSDGSGAGGSW